ncbi:aminotransferase class I/II-fold pyridoxal phosphate-dependent enzyme [Glaciihabitans arcticus]|uniref:cysteine-S-conjugate beta-lyase n=1 Tax=Glaciihabitans arcticus TaxID=2668039 RepID=A0A4Q9GX14_9MICO|nr:aminotransferase class I/II-fold pyridoxal phosphate-dependent enzyme [Glaciihabitans arcticus]TBN57777.1 aminotransferase class I/II-fold pyridoxal phosphate-dependent enzyme [Glaciihabitans arcticus]
MDVSADSLDLLRTRTSEKWTTYPADVLPLFVAEMDYPLAPVVAEAMIDRIRASDTGYVGSPLPVGAAFAGFASRRWGWTVDPANVRTTTDVSVAIVESLRQAISPGEAVVINSPVYPPFFALPVEAGGVVVDVPLRGDAIDLAGLDRAFAAGATAYLLCNPHNPLGLVHSRETLAAVAELAAKYGVTVISDEIHAPLTHSTALFTPWLDVSDAARATGITVTSASKAFNLAGVKCAVLVADGLRPLALLDSMTEEVLWRTSILGLHASVAAFEQGDEWLDGTIAAIEASSALLATLLSEQLPDVTFRPPAAGYLAWLGFPAPWGADPARLALERGVALASGPDFGASGFARLNLACSPDVLGEAVRKISASS